VPGSRISIPAAAVLLCGAAAAELPAERISTQALPGKPAPHWVWVSDIVVDHLEAGKAFLVDGDRGEFLGMLSTGVLFKALNLPADYEQFYSVETWYSRGVRGQRSDVVTFYEPTTLMPSGEVAIPAKRGTTFPTTLNPQLTDDDRFLLIYNFIETPAARWSTPRGRGASTCSAATAAC
jgi:methylamine dehydrogenase heavy chain